MGWCSTASTSAIPILIQQPPQHRLDQVSHALVQSLKSPSGGSPAFRKAFRSAASRERAALTRLPTGVRIDNSTSDRLTIIDIFTSDRQGLLFTIARTLFEMELSISVAKIGTYLDQVVDVFYVTDPQGRKILDDDRLQQISARLHQASRRRSDATTERTARRKFFPRRYCVGSDIRKHRLAHQRP